MPKKCYRRNCYFCFWKRMALQNFFIIFLLIVHVWRKSMQEKQLGSPCLFFKYAKQKATLKASCYVFVAIATNSVIIKITEFKLEILIYLSQPVSVKWNLNTQNLRVSNCRTLKLLKTVSSHLKLRLFLVIQKFQTNPKFSNI